ncbi:hypothetical protein [Halobacillus sp. A5]|uniref:hypothetical protein n=1 Tax=Halobacillus sp. A5 TaxID=2880263 RepID=UPI0020A66137|nr:hypothetical protein [Halobacillus sp. A5]MCP3026476.1 hypothetical protein [Halobacillus sp. A5]
MLCIFIFPAGCGTQTMESLILQEQTSPEGMATNDFIAHKAENQSELKKKWNDYNLTKDLPDVEWQDNYLLLLATYESSSCPHKIIGEDIDKVDNMISYQLKEVKKDCTADASPTTMVMKIDRTEVEISKVQLGSKTADIK